jgi:hypothetical protein
MISTAICGNSFTSRKKVSLSMRRACRSVLAVTVAVRGTSHRIAISPMIALRPTVATTTGPFGVAIDTSAEPSMMM